jgi:ribonucleotide reductase beta subunit family protein with ferritin-like domain
MSIFKPPFPLVNGLPRIMTPTEGYERHYPRIVEMGMDQLEKQFWTSSEMKVELDRMMLLYELSEEQKHAVLTVLMLFVRYERNVGDMWNKLARLFPRPEIQMVCSIIEMMERAVHAEFYDQVNKQFSLDKDEHYMAYTQDPVMNERAEWLGRLLGQQDDPVLGIIIFSMTETALLFAAFAILKSFQSNGYNLIPVIVRGTNQSAIDEDLHGCISAEIINTYYYEMGGSLLTDTVRLPQVMMAVDYAYAHECRILDVAIPGNSLNGTTKEQFRQFVKYRLNLWLSRLGLPPRFEITDCPVIDWFEKNTYAYKMIDFFSAGMGMEYESSWDTEAFKSAWRNNGLLTPTP